MKKNFLLYFIFKSFSLVSFVFSTPILLKGMGDESFGVWSTISSFMTWILVLDFGVGNYLRNRVSELESKGKSEDSLKEYAYGLLISFCSTIVVALFLLGITILIDWKVFLGIETQDIDPILAVIFIVIFTSFSFISNLIFFYLYGLQKAFLVALMQSSSHLAFIISAAMLKEFEVMSLASVSFAFGICQILPGTIASVKIIFSRRFLNHFRGFPGLKHVSNYLKIGGKFFIIQLTALILFSTDKILLSNLFGPRVVTDYEIVFRVFSLGLLFQSLLLTPAWGKYSQDFFAGRLDLVRSQLKFHLFVFFSLSIVLVMLGFFMNEILGLWVHQQVSREWFIFAVMFYALLMIWNNVFAIFLNATNNIDLTFRICLAVMVFNLPISYYLAKTQLKEIGIILGTILSLLPAAVLTPIQVFRLTMSLGDEKTQAIHSQT